MSEMSGSAKRLRVIAESDPFPEGVKRPVTRGDCKDMPRPCPFVSCSYNLYLEVSDEGTLKLNFPEREVWEMKESCALDVADRGPATLETVGAGLNITRERVRQIEAQKLHGLRRVVGHLRLDKPGKRLGVESSR